MCVWGSRGKLRAMHLRQRQQLHDDVKAAAHASDVLVRMALQTSQYVNVIFWRYPGMHRAPSDTAISMVTHLLQALLMLLDLAEEHQEQRGPVMI